MCIRDRCRGARDDGTFSDWNAEVYDMLQIRLLSYNANAVESWDISITIMIVYANKLLDLNFIIRVMYAYQVLQFAITLLRIPYISSVLFNYLIPLHLNITNQHRRWIFLSMSSVRVSRVTPSMCHVPCQMMMMMMMMMMMIMMMTIAKMKGQWCNQWLV